MAKTTTTANATLEHQAAMTGDEPIMVACPKCGAEQEDHDGFGVLRCEACLYCTHASVDGGVCGLCGETGLADLPSFEPTPSREERLAELDARDDALNGHAPAGVRPSEQCGVLAGSGPYAGRRCTYADHPSNQPHSWEVTSEPLSEQPGHVYDDAEQPTLPGTPEPVQTEYSVPTEASFGKAKLTPAHGLRAIGDRLIADDDNLEHLRGIEIRYAWRRRGGTTGGNKRFARIKRPSVWEHFLTGGKPEFLVDLSADHCREFRFTDRQIEAALYEQLVRTERDDDDHDAFRINGPDFSGSIATLDRYGLWRDDLREMHAHVAKLPLEEAIDQADAEDADDGEDE